MLVDGKAIAADIKGQLKKEIQEREKPPTFFIFSVGENLVSEKFLTIKKKFAVDVGVRVIEKHFDKTNIKELSQEIISAAGNGNSGIIVQLPLPKNIERQAVLNMIPLMHDIDVLSEGAFELYRDGTLPILPPVVGAIKEILLRHNVFVGNKNVLIVGKGKLVGLPAAIWFERHQSNVTVIDEHTLNPKRYMLNADIIVSGAGVPGLIKPDMVKEDVVLLDAGTSESQGKISGDMDPECFKKASLATPVPGGIGPLTVAMLFKNLLELTRKRS